MKLIAGLVLGVVLGMPAGAATTPEEPTLCIVEQATGFSFDQKTKSWKQTNFAPGEKYILKRVENKTLGDTDKGIAGSPRAEWGVWEFGFYLFGDVFCAADVDDNGYLWCHGSVDNVFNISLHSGRFLRTYTGLYAVDDPSAYSDEHADKPVIEIGKCTAL